MSEEGVVLSPIMGSCLVLPKENNTTILDYSSTFSGPLTSGPLCLLYKCLPRKVRGLVDHHENASMCNQFIHGGIKENQDNSQRQLNRLVF